MFKLALPLGILTVIGLASPAQCVSPAVQRAVLEIRPVYAPSDSMYLSYTALFSVRAHLRDRTKAESIAKFDLGADNLNALRSFLVAVDEDINDAVRGTAFLQLDLAKLRAGYKKGSDLVPTVTPLSWTDDQVGAVAVFCHRFLNSEIRLRTAERQIAVGSLGLMVAWDQAATFKADPYLSTSSFADYLQVYRNELARKPKELNDLKAVSPKHFSEIAAFYASSKYAPKVNWSSLDKPSISDETVIAAANRQIDSNEMLLATYIDTRGLADEKPALARDAFSVDKILIYNWPDKEPNKRGVYRFLKTIPDAKAIWFDIPTK